MKMNEKLNHLNSICDRFEDEWANGRKPSISEFTDKADPELKNDLVFELLAIDIEYRLQGEEGLDINAYEKFGHHIVQRAKQIVSKLQRKKEERDLWGQTRTQSGNAPSPIRVNHKPSSRIGPYKLLQKLGEGGMGTVWMAEQEKPVRRRVAVKMVKSGQDNAQVLARFEAERQALAMMNHKNIAQILDVGATDQGQPYFVMELVHGIPFNEFCDQNKLSINQRLELFAHVCNAVQHAHQKGVIHRDLKPSNVLVCLFDGVAVPKVIDFGLAKALQHGTKLTDRTMFTEFGQIVGTLAYMSPEQAEMNQLDVDTRTDVYSLGVMLYELLTGSTPIELKKLREEAFLKVLESIREIEPPRPSARLSNQTNEAVSGVSQQRQIEPEKLRAILRGELDWIVMKSLEKDRSRRYETAKDFAEDIRCYLDGDIVEARPPSSSYRLRKIFQKNKGLVASVSAILLLLLAGIAGTTFGLIRANQKTAIAEESERKAIAAQRESLDAKERALEEKRKAQAEKSRADEEAKKARDSDAAGKFQLAVSRWDAERPGEARSLLDEIPEEYRELEWHFSKRYFLGSELTCYGHTKSVNRAVFSPDGQRIATASTDKKIKIWDATSGAELQTLSGHGSNVTWVCFSPDGQRIASSSSDKTIKIWDAFTGKELNTLKGHTDIVLSVSFSPDGKRIASSGHDASVRIWDLARRKEQKILTGHKGRVYGVDFSSNGQQVASASADGTIKLWDAASGAELQTLSGHGGHVTSVCFSPDDRRIASTGWDNSLRIWDAVNGKQLKNIYAHRGPAWCAVFSPDGRRIATAGGGYNTVKVWDAVSGKGRRTLCGHAGPVFSVAFSPDGHRLASAGSSDNTMKIWDVLDSNRVKTLNGHLEGVTSVAFSPDGQRIASASSDKKIKVWDALHNSELLTLNGHAGKVNSVAFSPNGRRIASASSDKKIKIWDADSGVVIKTLSGHNSAVNSVVFSPSGQRIVSGSSDKTVKIWDTKSGGVIETCDGHTESVNSVAFSPDGQQIASGSSDGMIKIWNSIVGKEILTLASNSIVNSVSFSPDGNRIASGNSDYTLSIWDAVSGTELQKLRGHTDPRVLGVTFSPNGQRLLSAGFDHTIRIWSADGGKELQTILAHHLGVDGVAISPDAQRICSGSSDKSIKLWNASSDHELRTLQGHTSKVTGVCFSADGERIYSQSSNEKFVWRARTGRLEESSTWEAINVSRLNSSQSTSPDGRWLVTIEGKRLILVDLKYKNIPWEKSYRVTESHIKPWWHQKKADEAAFDKDWFAVTFHRAWLMKSDPSQPENYDALHDSIEKLKEVFLGQEKDLEIYLPLIVKQMQTLPRGQKRTDQKSNF